jgi:LPXTG-motif cell wall-anchored protein
VPSACRRIAALLAAACLGVGGPVAVAHGQRAVAAQSSGSDLEPLTPTPQGGGAKTPKPQPKPRPAPKPTRLPDTGIDARLLLLAGATLLVVGIGLRLRYAPERF